MISESELRVRTVNLWRTTSREYSEIHRHKSPVIHKFLQETGAGRSLYKVSLGVPGFPHDISEGSGLWREHP